MSDAARLRQSWMTDVPPFSAVLAAVPVADLERAEAFYAALLGRPCDERPMPGLAQWELPGAGTLQVVLDAERAGGGLLTLLASDLGATLGAAARRGLEVPAAAAGEVVDAFARLEDPTATPSRSSASGPRLHESAWGQR